MQSYDPQSIEPKWQKRWAEAKVFRAEETASKPKYYLLEMLPYPSGRIHMGHVRNYTIGDVVARYKMMQGFSVLHPMGWDAFGMPAENAAIKNKIPPAKWTYDNIGTMRTQLKRLGLSYDWEREFATCDPEYYRWEQLIFIKMFEKGLVFRKSSNVNWCDTCQTVLANEQVEQGNCWRCESPVMQKLLEQWYFKLSAYADELLRDIDDKLQGWPERVQTMQREWIGRSEGALIDFPIEGTFPSPMLMHRHSPRETSPILSVFTTRPDTLPGVTFLSLACEHPLALELAKKGGREKEFEKFAAKAGKIERMKRLTGEYEKEGEFTGSFCLHPITKEKLPIYAANFVLTDYGTGAVMGVPAHDQRDFELAKKYRLPIKVVIQPEGQTLDPNIMIEAYEGGESLQAKLDVIKTIEKQGVGKKSVTFKLKDWCISRQRAWGTPIPIIYCETCGALPVPEDDLPVVLPKDVKITGKAGSPLAQCADFVNATCPKCRKKARRETDTMDTFVESSWYFFRYCSPKFDQGPFDPKAVAYWFPIDQYIGGIEHAVGHLIYCRFFTKVLRDLGFLKLDEPVKNLLTQGMVCLGGHAMSKSRGNVVDPDAIADKYGIDTARVFTLFAAPPEKDLEWSEEGVEGMFRFLGRVWRLAEIQNPKSKIQNKSQIPTPKMLEWKNKTIKRVTEDIERFHFNTALAALMEYMNSGEVDVETLVILLSPFAPHIAEELWEKLGHTESILKTPWPKWDPAALVQTTMTIVVQVNGKLRGEMDIPVDQAEEAIKEAAQKLEKVKVHTAGKEIKKIIYVPKKLVNIVVS